MPDDVPRSHLLEFDDLSKAWRLSRRRGEGGEQVSWQGGQSLAGSASKARPRAKKMPPKPSAGKRKARDAESHPAEPEPNTGPSGNSSMMPPPCPALLVQDYKRRVGGNMP